MSKCNYNPYGKIKGMILIKSPSRYMVKKYGYSIACEIALKKTLTNKKASQ